MTNPINPNDPNYWQINVAFLIDVLQEKARQLVQTGPGNFQNDFERGIHQGRINELTEVLETIKREIYVVNPYDGSVVPPPVQLVDEDQPANCPPQPDQNQNGPYIPPIDADNENPGDPI